MGLVYDQYDAKALFRVDKWEQILQKWEQILQKCEQIFQRTERMSTGPPHFSTMVCENVKTNDSACDKIKREDELEDYYATPHKHLLQWPGVRELLNSAKSLPKDNYVAEVEQRPTLALYTRGECTDEDDDSQNDQASAEESGGSILQTRERGARSSEPIFSDTSRPNSPLDLDRSIINRFYNSYIKHIHIMHPFLDIQQLRNLFESFTKDYCGPSAGVVRGSNNERPLKRKRDVRLQLDYPGTALVWLVLALGEICLHKEMLPSMLLADVTARNIDMIPGLVFYAEAAKVLGSRSDGNELIHAQMFLLAGFYKGQLARVTESMSWITHASSALMHLLDR